MLKTIGLSCNHCGGPLKVPAETRFVTCAHCSSSLEVQREGDAVFTKVLQAIDERTAEMSSNLATIKLQNDLERLDREWAMTSEQYLIRSKDGSTSRPTSGGATLIAIASAVLGMVVACVMFGEWGAPGLLLGMLIFTWVLYFGWCTVDNATEYEKRDADYQRQRIRLVGQIDGCRVKRL